MTGKPGNSVQCAFCGGRAVEGSATVPFVLGQTIVVVREVPTFVCEECGEPFLTGRATDVVMELLSRLQSMGTEVSVVTYAEHEDSSLLSAR